MTESGAENEGRTVEFPDEPGGAAGAGATSRATEEARVPADEPASPYRNLLVPLVVVPALIVMVFVLVAAFFGTITGSEASPSENVDRLLHGGANERTQAAFNLVRQTLEEWESRPAGEVAMQADETLLPKLRRAWEDTSELSAPGDVPIPLALSILLVQMGDADGAQRLASMTELAPELDPTGEYRAYAGFSLGAVGARLDTPNQAIGRAALLRLIDDPDPGLRMVGAISLQTFPGDETHAALRGLLVESSLELRGNAALSLAQLGHADGRDVLVAMLDPKSYEREHEARSEKWAKGRLVSESRRKALAALAKLDELPDDDQLARLAEEDPDAELRELARQLLSGRG